MFLNRLKAAALTFSSVLMLVSSVAHSQNTSDRTAHVSSFGNIYNYRFGYDSPFQPSNIQTEDGKFIDPRTILSAEYCSHCHQAVHAQWRQSAHSNSNRAPWYLKNVKLLNDEKGVEFSRHCEGCHDPFAVVTGALTQGGPQERPYDVDGVSCVVCHSISTVDTRGTGSFKLGIPAVLVDADGHPLRRLVSDDEILTHLDRHSKAVMKDLYRTPEFCGACHKAALPEALNGYKWQRAISLYDEWQTSAFAKQSPLPFYKKDGISTCQTCHMPREAASGTEYAAKDKTIVSHRWLGANTMVPKYYGFDEQAAKVVAFLRNAVFNVDIFSIETVHDPEEPTAGFPSHIIAPLGLTPFDLTPGLRITVGVVIQNKGIGHSHVPEQRDMYESWVDFTVKNSAGVTILESGALEADGSLDPEAHNFTNRLVNKESKINSLHQVWNNRVVAYNNTIQSGRSQLVRYCFTMPTSGRIVVTATVRYRRFDQHFIDFGMMPGYVQPIVDMASATRTLLPGLNPSGPSAAGENPIWMRWNNYGVALLDAQKYEASAEAFKQVAVLRPDYADAYTNIAIADDQEAKYDQALPSLMKSLVLDPNNSRALYYLGLVKRNEGDLEGAVKDFQQVALSFPRSRDVHRELGYSYYQQQNFDKALSEYQAVQSIDPDDLSAHYNLSVLYRRRGMEKEAAEQAKAFADQNSDPAAMTYAVQYLGQHPEVVQENSLWHVHNLHTLLSTQANGEDGSKRQ